MLIDTERCIGCWACAIACKVENSIGEGLWWQRVDTVGGVHPDTSTGTFPFLDKHYEPQQCFHCQDPPCLAVCPTDAITQRPDGIVSIDHETCIGCGYCAVACPYDAIEVNITDPVLPRGLEAGHGASEVRPRRAGVAEKCTFCSHRVDQQLDPACVVACPTDAIVFGDAENESGDLASLLRSRDTERRHESLGADPSVWYVPFRKGTRQKRSGTSQR